jgi:hypothetical protein
MPNAAAYILGAESEQRAINIQGRGVCDVQQGVPHDNPDRDRQRDCDQRPDVASPWKEHGEHRSDTTNDAMMTNAYSRRETTVI